MQPWMLDTAVMILILGITYALTSEGLWGAALTFFNVLFAAVVALNFYEWAAAFLAEQGSAFADWADLLSLSGLFILTLTLLKLATEQMAPSLVAFPSIVENIGRLIFGLLGGTLTVAFLLLMANTAPVHKKAFGMLDATSEPPFGMAIDHKLLGFFRHTSGSIFPSYSGETTTAEYGNARVFDPNGTWLIEHQNARPFAWDDSAPAPDSDADGGMAPPPAAENSPRVPGGTAGAAVGLAPQE